MHALNNKVSKEKAKLHSLNREINNLLVLVGIVNIPLLIEQEGRSTSV